MTKRLVMTLAALVASVALFAQSYSGGVRGTVVNRNGRQPVENARLILLQGASEIATAVSAEDGTFLIENLADGMYTLVVDAPEFLETQVQVTVNDGYVKNMFNISLTGVQRVTELDDDSFAAFDMDAHTMFKRVLSAASKRDSYGGTHPRYKYRRACLSRAFMPKTCLSRSR